jgi:hypothetical protein
MRILRYTTGFRSCPRSPVGASVRPAWLLFALLLLLVRVATSAATGVDAAPPRLPCGIASYPAVPALDARPNIGLWTAKTLGKGWAPPACTGWLTAPTALVVAVAGHFTDGRDLDAMLARIGTISALREVRYWSVTDKRWNALFIRPTSIGSADSKTPRSDFSATEIQSGGALYFQSFDSHLSGELITRLSTKELGAERIVLEMANVSPMRWLAFTIVPPGGMQTLYILDHQSDGSWQFYSLTRIVNASSFLSQLVTGPSYVNRAVAMYRYIAGIPTDRDPPAMP